MPTRTKEKIPSAALFLEPGEPAESPESPESPESAASSLAPDTRIRAESTIEWWRASSIGTDRRVNTRPIDEAWVRRMSDPAVFNWDFLGTIAASLREDGSRISIDGQHRLALVAAVGKPDAEMKCEVFTGLSLAQEAALFLGLNAGRTVRPVSLFLAKVTMGDPVCSEILRIAEDCSWTITATPGRGVLSCVSAMTRVHTRDIAQNTKGGLTPMALRDTLMLLTTAWGFHDQTGHESLVTGLGNLLIRDGEVLRGHRSGGVTGMERLAAVLDEYGSDPSGLLNKAKTFQASRVPRIGLPVAVAEQLRMTWNVGMQSRRLSAFVR